MATTEVRLTRVGAAEILDKPVSREQVVAVLERWIPGWVR